MDTISNKIIDTYEDLKPSMNTNLSIQTIKDVLFLCFIIFCSWTLIETCMRLYNFCMSAAIKVCFVGILIIVYVYYQYNNEDSDSNE